MKIAEILDTLDIEEEIVIEAELIEEDLILPANQAEVDAHIAENREKENLQNQTHGDQCGNCRKGQNQTPNPRAVMRYCTFNGVMVSKFQAGCEKFEFKEKSLWEPDT